MDSDENWKRQEIQAPASVRNPDPGARESGAFEKLSDDLEHLKLCSIRQKLSPEHQQQFDLLTLRQLRQLVALVDERPDGIDWATQQFHWIRPHLVKYFR